MNRLPLLTLIPAAFCILAVSVYSQPDMSHTARHRDFLNPGLSSFPNFVISVNDSAKEIVIDPDVFIFDPSAEAAAYLNGDTISYVQSATKHRFILRSDTLSYSGFENRSTDFRLDTPVTVCIFPLLDGTETSATWTGKVKYGGSLMLKEITGTSSSRVNSGWSFTDGADTVRNATRLTWTLDMAYLDKEKVQVELPDSVISEMISDMKVEVEAAMAERLLTERALWFSESARYPILTESRVSRVIGNQGSAVADTVARSFLATYYPAENQYADTGEEPDSAPRKVRATGDNAPYLEEYTGSKRLSVGEPTATETAVSVTLSSYEGAVEGVLAIYTDSGIRIGEAMTIMIGPVPASYTIGLPSGSKGVFLLTVGTAEETHTRKVII
ncbi:MAG: hypothetical protein K2G85_04360 [Muribaculaceae bacterium]|nr:hypothetical protein [Muribaculaceae bacterium]